MRDYGISDLDAWGGVNNLKTQRAGDPKVIEKKNE